MNVLIRLISCHPTRVCDVWQNGGLVILIVVEFGAEQGVPSVPQIRQGTTAATVVDRGKGVMAE